MGAGGEKVEFGGDVGALQCLEEDERTLRVVVERVDDEHGRRGGVQARGNVVAKRVGARVGEAAAVDGEVEIGPGGKVVGGVDARVLAVSGFMIRGEKDVDLGAGGETDGADGGWVDVPVGGARADEAHGALGVLKTGTPAFFGIAGRDAVFEEEGGKTLGVEPFGDLIALVFEGETFETAAGDDEHGGAGAFVGGRKKDGERGDGDVRDLVERTRAIGEDVFGGERGGFVGRGVGPETDDFGRREGDVGERGGVGSGLRESGDSGGQEDSEGEEEGGALHGLEESEKKAEKCRTIERRSN